MKNLYRLMMGFLLGVLLLPDSLEAKEQPSWHGIRTPVPLSTQSEGYTNWQWLHPLPHGNDNRAVWLFDSTTWIVAGDVGSVMKTTNAGLNWMIQFHAGDQANFKDIRFIDNYTGFIAGSELIKSTDSGSTWTVVNTTHNGAFNGISFPSHDTGFVVGDHGTILRTTDAGGSWSTTVVDQNLNILRVSACDPLHAFAIAHDRSTWLGKGILVKTTDGGEHWSTSVINNTINFGDLSVCFTDQLHGWVAGWTNGGTYYYSPSYVLHTTDGGTSWSVQEFKDENGGPYAFTRVDFADANHGIVVGALGALLWTTDGGVTWGQRDGGGENDVKLLNDHIGIAVGGSGRVYLTTDCGNSWTDIVPNLEVCGGLAFPDSAHGFALGWGGTLLKTIDGGNTWNLLPASVGGYGIAFKDMNNGITVGGNSAWLTTDGGLTWDYHWNISGGPGLRDVKICGDSVWAVGDAGTIVCSTDGGQSWSSQVSGTTERLNKVYFSDAIHGTAAGTDGVIVHTIDGGEHWTAQTSGTVAELRDVFMLDADYGFIAGYGGIFKTTNGGTNWALVSALGPEGIYFVNQNVGVAAGGGGEIDRTTDGGVTWTHWNNPCTVWFYHILCVRSGAGSVAYASGGGGAIVVAAISPQSSRTWTWTGLVDSSWNNPDNWNPAAVPQPGDSILIPPAAHPPIMDSLRMQITVASLNIFSGGKLVISDAVGRLVVLGDMIIDGTLEIQSTAAPSILVGGNWIVGSGGGSTSPRAVRKMQNLSSTGDDGFIPSHSRVEFSGPGTMSGTFYNLSLDTLITVGSNGNILILNQATLLSDLTMRPNDTIYVRTGFDQPIIGSGRVVGGTIGHFTLYAITTTAGDHGRTSPAGISSAISGRDFRVVFLPDAGYHVDSVFVDGTKVDSISGYTIPQVNGPHAIRVVFAIDQNTIVAMAGSHGAITPPGPVVFTPGGSQRFVFIPDVGYHADSVFIDDFPVDSISGYTFTNLSASHVLRVVFANRYTITAMAGSHGSITPAGHIGLIPGGNQRFLFTSDAGYHVDSVFVDSMPVDSSAGYTFINVTGPHSIRVVFANRYIITATAGSHGTVAPNGPVAVTPGSNRRFVFTPDHNYQVASAFVDDVPIDSIAGYTFTNVNSNHTIQCMFGITTTLSISMANRWNLVSVPLTVGDYSRTSLFHDAISDAYMYNDGYQPRGTLTNGIGYWLKFNSTQTISIVGFQCLNDTFSLKAGWNMVGSISCPVPVTSITGESPGLTLSKFFGYTNGYNRVDTIYPGRGYWVKAGQDGAIILSVSSSAASTNRITIIPTMDLPPLPPSEESTLMDRYSLEYTLEQNYPNPFNPTTALNYTLPSDSYVRLSVYNTLGQEIGILVEGAQGAGYKEIEWDAGNTPSGLYFYRLEATSANDPAKSFTQTKKMMLVK